MADLAQLGIQIDARSVKEGVSELNKLTAAGAESEMAIVRVGDASAATGAKVKGASAQAAFFAANAQRMAANATATGSGMVAMGRASGVAANQMQNLGFQINDIAVGLASGQAPMRVFVQQGAQIGQIMGQAGVGVRGFATELLRAVGILKVTTDATAAADAAAATGAAKAIATVSARSAANIAAADTELALALAAIRTATTSDALTAAQTRLAAAHQGVAAAAAEAAIAEDALAVAQGRAARAEKAAAATRVVSLGATAGVLTGTAVAAGLVFGAFKTFQSEIAKTGELEKYANSLGLTKKEMKELRQEVGGFSSDEMKDAENSLRAFEVTWGDVFNGLAKTASDALDLSPAWNKFKADAADAFSDVLRSSVSAASKIYGIWNTVLANAPKITTGPIPHFEAGNMLSVDEFWKQVGERSEAAQKKISKNLQTIRSNIIGATRDRIDSEANAIIEGRRERNARKPRKASDHGLADALALLDAQIKGQWALAAAYGVSDVAVMKATALQKAEEQAIRKKGQVGIFYEKELAKAVATRAAEGAHVAADLKDEATARGAANNMVSSGLLPAAEAAHWLELDTKLRPLAAAYAIAEGDAKERLADIMAGVTKGYADNNAETARAQVLAATASDKEKLEMLQLELTLINKTNAERAIALAQLQAEQYLRANPGATKQEAADYVATQVAIAAITEELARSRSEAEKFLDALGLIAEQASATADIMASAFGNIGNVFGGLIANIASYSEARQALAMDVATGNKTQAEADKALATLQARNIGAGIAGVKSLFKEKSTAYKVMQAIEMAYAAFQMVNTIRSIAMDTAKTTSSVANSGARAAADGVAAIAKAIASLPFPLNLAAGAATAAALVAFGVKVFGGGGGGSSGPSMPTAEDIQAGQGTGSVLGDAKAKSNSIANSLEIVAANTNRDLEYSNDMLKSLRSIDFGISKLAGTIARQIQVSGSMFDTSGLKLGTSGSSGFLGIGAKMTTRTLWDLGMTLNSASVADIIANGITGQTYQVVQKVKKKSGFLGIGGGTKTSYTTTTGAIDQDITNAITDVISSLRSGILSAADVIGLQGAQAILDSFQVSIGTISFKDMTGEQIEDTLNAVFSKVGDDMSRAVFPALAELQKVGEGLFETFMRVAREYQVVDVALRSIGKEFGAVGIGSVAARDALVQLFDGLDGFVEATSFFRDNFLSAAEQILPVQSAVVAEMQRLGLAGIVTRDQFKAAVLGLDLTTAAGREMYASLLAVAPAFDKVLDHFEQANKATIDGLKNTADQFNGFAASLRKYRETLFATDAAQGNAYATLRSRFVATAALASTGDATALGGLESSGKAFLDSARNNASTMQQYLRDVALVAQGVDQGIFAAESVADYAELQLEALQNSVSILGSIDTNIAALTGAVVGGVQTVPTPVVGSPAGVAPSPTSPTSPDDGAIVGELRALREEQMASNLRIAENTSTLTRLWSRIDGDGLLIRTDADTPIQTEVV